MSTVNSRDPRPQAPGALSGNPVHSGLMLGTSRDWRGPGLGHVPAGDPHPCRDSAPSPKPRGGSLWGLLLHCTPRHPSTDTPAAEEAGGLCRRAGPGLPWQPRAPFSCRLILGGSRRTLWRARVYRPAFLSATPPAQKCTRGHRPGGCCREGWLEGCLVTAAGWAVRPRGRGRPDWWQPRRATELCSPLPRASTSCTGAGGGGRGRLGDRAGKEGGPGVGGREGLRGARGRGPLARRGFTPSSPCSLATWLPAPSHWT